jgi:4-aminobutyrate aminotransferase-like enzyme
MTDDLAQIVTAIPGPRSIELGEALRSHESRNVTYIAPDFPVFWESAEGALVIDADGNRFIDCTGAFGVATTGHANPVVAKAIADQAARLPHGMGDVHPSAMKARLLEALAALVPIENAKTYLCSTGAEAVEWALKTAFLATGEAYALSFGGGYHGLTLATLEVCGIPKFRTPFRKLLKEKTSFTRFPDQREPKALEKALDAVGKTLRRDSSIGAVIVEPIQGRAGVVIPPDGFLRGLSGLCKENDAVLIVDEIYTGLGRTGSMFAFEREDMIPDIVCIGKALGGGFPISAAIARGEIAQAWPLSDGEALHTSTFLGNPMGCAAALANLGEIERLGIPRIAAEREPLLRDRFETIARFNPAVVNVRGRGMLWAIEFKSPTMANTVVLRALQRGLLLLQSGVSGECVTFAPPPIIGAAQLRHAFDIIGTIVRELEAAV